MPVRALLAAGLVASQAATVSAQNEMALVQHPNFTATGMHVDITMLLMVILFGITTAMLGYLIGTRSTRAEPIQAGYVPPPPPPQPAAPPLQQPPDYQAFHGAQHGPTLMHLNGDGPGEEIGECWTTFSGE
eukprot:11555906-Alexandrium_andersonii.AAC.1